MVRLFILMAIVVLVVLFIQQLRSYLVRDKKRQELEDAKLEGELLDMDKQIAEEKSRQKNVASEIEEIHSEVSDKGSNNAHATSESTDTKKDTHNE